MPPSAEIVVDWLAAVVGNDPQDSIITKAERVAFDTWLVPINSSHNIKVAALEQASQWF